VTAKVRVFTDESRAKISAARMGQRISPETKAKIGAANKGRIVSVELRAKIGAARLGRSFGPLSAEHRAKIGAANRLAATGSWATGPRVDSLKTMGTFAMFGEALRLRDGDLCQLCLTPIDFALPLRTRWSRAVDHIIPHAGGGLDTLDNFWLVHMSCNSKKGARHIGRPDGTTDVRRTLLSPQPVTDDHR
jgi:hypothetical protein